MEHKTSMKPIVEEREEMMVCVTGGKPTLRIARFLNPSVMSVYEAMEVPLAPPLLSETISSKSNAWPLKVQFKGWRVPMKKWKQWVDKLVPLHGTIWKKACIYDAIMGSTYEVRKCENSVLGLAEFWCSGTNTFVFPWGEASITLEDVLILGGFSLLGEPVTSSLASNMVEINEKITEEYTMIVKYHPSHKIEYSKWLNHFMESKDIDRNMEHVAFLALWLSRYVFPRYPHDFVDEHVFSIAIHLAHGTRIALAPAVLSSLYRDLGLLKRNSIYEVWAPFHIVQMWVWERFSLLRPATIQLLREGEPRVAQWHKSSCSLNLMYVRSVMKLSENFQWRCYARHVMNWQHPSFYKDKEMWVAYDSNIDDELRSFAHCLRASELVGLDCIEQYLPHRVAMQFGLDQDLPGYITRANSRWEDAWKTYNKSIEKAAFYVPPRHSESDVTTRYLEWWKRLMRNCSGETTENLLPLRRIEGCKGLKNEVKEESHGSDPYEFLPKNKKQKLQVEVKLENCSDVGELPISQSLELSRNRTEVVSLAVSVVKPSSSFQSPTSLPSAAMSDIEINRRFLNLEKVVGELPISQSLEFSRNSTEVVNLAVSGVKPSSSSQTPTSLPSATMSDMEINRRFLKLEKEVAWLKDMLMAQVELKKDK